LITGGTGRVGSAVAARLEAEGFAVLAAGRRDGDVSRPDEARALVERAAAELGGLDLLVNAASAGFEPRPVEDVSEDDWDKAVGSTAKASFFVTQAAVPHLRASSLGLVVMIEDVAAYRPWPSFAPHCAGKAAQAMLTRVLARALAPEIRVCGIAPGPVAVEPGQEERRAAETLLGRIGSPDDIADAILYLVGAEFVTGSTIFVDGGRLLT
jgi:pteridine reductase